MYIHYIKMIIYSLASVNYASLSGDETQATVTYEAIKPVHKCPLNPGMS